MNAWDTLMWIIHKNTRLPTKISYGGPTWDLAGIRDLYKECYDNESEARQIAAILSVCNPIGFSVSRNTND